MNLKEELGSAIYNQIPKEVQQRLNAWVPKGRFDEVNARKKELEGQIKELTPVVEEYEKLKPQLEDMKTAAGENSTLKQQLEDLQGQLGAYPKQIDDLQKANTAWEEKYKHNALDSAIKFQLSQANLNPKYMDMILTKIDKGQLELAEDGSATGLEDQLKTIQTDYSEFFGGAPSGMGSKGNPVRQSFSPEAITQQTLNELADKAKLSGREEDRIAYAQAKNQLALQNNPQ